MLPRFEILEHTADVGIRAFGESLPGLFENAALGVQFLALDPAGVAAVNSYALEATAEDFDSLSVNWLNEIAFYLDGKRVAICRIQIETITPTAVSARIWGEARDPSRHAARLVVKAATWHKLSIRVHDGSWVAEVYLDV
jgi:SHS2 domain-containing protein